MAEYCWKRIAHNPRNRSVHPALWLHGDVYQLVRKGLAVDAPLHHYASHSRSRFSVLLQFGNPGVLCNIRDTPEERAANQEKAHALLWNAGLAPGVMLQAGLDQAVPLAVREAFYRCLKRFVNFYFRREQGRNAFIRGRPPAT